MKTQFFRFLALSFAFLIFSAAAFAQSNSLTVEIPFNFHVGNEKLSAGKYEVKRINTNSFLLSNKDGNAKVLAQTPLSLENVKSSDSAQLIFNRYGNKYFLREIFSVSNTVGRGLYESKSEKIARRGEQDKDEMAKKTKPSQIALTMKTN